MSTTTIQNLGSHSFYLHLKQMEQEYPKAYPPGAAERYLKITRNPKPPVPAGSPLHVEDHLLACFGQNANLNFGQIHARIQSALGVPCSKATLSDALRRLACQGRLIRKGLPGKYTYCLSLDSKQKNQRNTVPKTFFNRRAVKAKCHAAS